MTEAEQLQEKHARELEQARWNDEVRGIFTEVGIPDPTQIIDQRNSVWITWRQPLPYEVDRGARHIPDLIDLADRIAQDVSLLPRVIRSGAFLHNCHADEIAKVREREPVFRYEHEACPYWLTVSEYGTQLNFEGWLRKRLVRCRIELTRGPSWGAVSLRADADRWAPHGPVRRYYNRHITRPPGYEAIVYGVPADQMGHGIVYHRGEVRLASEFLTGLR